MGYDGTDMTLVKPRTHARTQADLDDSSSYEARQKPHKPASHGGITGASVGNTAVDGRGWAGWRPQFCQFQSWDDLIVLQIYNSQRCLAVNNGLDASLATLHPVANV